MSFKHQDKKKKDWVWIVNLILTILCVLWTIIGVIAISYIAYTYNILGDDQQLENFAKNLNLGNDVKIESGKMIIMNSSYDLREVVNLGFNYINGLLIFNVVCNTITLITTIYNLIASRCQHVGAVRIIFNIVSCLCSVATLRLISFVLFIVYCIGLFKQRNKNLLGKTSKKYRSRY